MSDTGLLCHLLAIQTTEHLKSHPLMGAIFETFIISECFKRIHNLGENPRLYFWRDQAKNEIDLLIYDGRNGFPIEIKSSFSFHSDFTKTIKSWLQLKNNPSNQGSIIYCGESVNTSRDIPGLPWYTL